MIEKFSEIIRYPNFVTFFERFQNFVSSYYTDIINFYSGKLIFIDKEAVSSLNELINEYENIIELIELNKSRISYDLNSWDIVDNIDDVGVKLQTIKNTPKWIRSSIDIDYSNFQIVDKFLKSYQTLESMAQELGSNNPDKDWANISVNNTLEEDSYTFEGEKTLKIRIQYLVGTTPVNSVDVMVGDNVLGKDLFRKITFESEDLKCLVPQETLNQSAEIILQVSRGSVQEFPFLGINKEQTVSNIKSLQYPSLFRQLTEMFKQDDSFSEIQLIDTSFNQDAFFMKILIISRSGYSTEQMFKIFDDTYDDSFN